MKMIFCCMLLLGGVGKVHAQTNAHDQPPAFSGESMIPAGKLRVHCIVSGHGSPVLFLHAGYQDLHMWDVQDTYFSKRDLVVRMDLPGHGLTEGIDTTLEVADVIRIVMDSLHIGQADVVGLSMGAACATELTLAYPERVRKLVVVSPGLSGWRDVMQMDSLSMRLLLRMDTVRQTGDRAAVATYFTELWCDGPYRSSSQVKPEARDYIYRTTLANKMNDTAYPRFHHPTAARRLKEIKCPVMVIWGDRDMPFIRRVADWYKHELPRAQPVKIHAVAHMLNLEETEAFNKLVDEWLTQR